MITSDYNPYNHIKKYNYLLLLLLDIYNKKLLKFGFLVGRKS
jgi:hypothetical protein